MNPEQTKRVILDVHNDIDNLTVFIKICIVDGKIDRQAGGEILRIIKDNNEKLLNAL